MIRVTPNESQSLSGGAPAFFTAYCLDCGRQFNQLEIELILYHQRILR
jgi:hypothetical protein